MSDAASRQSYYLLIAGDVIKHVSSHNYPARSGNENNVSIIDVFSFDPFSVN